jgi:hypothetical protein
LKADGEVLVVAERLVLGLAAAAQSCPRQRLDASVLAPDLDLAGHQERPVADRYDRGSSIRFLARLAIEPPIQEGATRASAHDIGHLLGAGGVRKDPRSPLELEDLSFAANAFADVDTHVQVEADLDIPPAIDLSHPPNIEGRGDG